MGRISKLDPAVVHRIAAGEVIQRPCNAVKELIENSVDAGATMVQVTLQDGGLKQIQIQDNGSGILKEDLPLLCERFATSKLQKFEDLSSMKTFGFRGEALASISHVARVTVITKTQESQAEYLNGALMSDPVPMAGNQGTTIIISDLFYNVPTRLKGLGSGTDEYSQTLKVLQKYAIELAGCVGLSCRKTNGNGCDLQTSATLAPTSADVIKNIHGSALSKSLTSIDEEHPELGQVRLSGCFSIPTFHQKSLQFVLFINGRLVDSSPIKRAVMGLYSQLLPKGTGPFVYLSLSLPPQNVDVNVHPTKSEVFFLHEQEILEFIVKSIRAALQNTDLPLSTPISSTQERMTAFVSSQPRSSQSLELETSSQSQSQPFSDFRATPSQLRQPDIVPKKYPHQLVHSDPKSRTLDTFILNVSKRPKIEDNLPEINEHRSSSHKIEIGTIQKDSREDEPKSNKTEKKQEVGENFEDPRELSSVKSLIARIEADRHDRLTEMIKNSVIVGLFDDTTLLIQYQSKLLMIKHMKFASDLFYQKCLLGFGFHDSWTFEEPFDILQLLAVHVRSYYPESADEIDQITGFLSENSEMLLEYFSLQISNGQLRSLPRLLEGLARPPDDIIADLLFRLATVVNWDDENECFDDISKLLSRVFSALACNQPRQEEYVRHFLYPALKGSDLSKFGHVLGYAKELVATGAITEMTSTHELYKIFERC